MTSGKKVVIVIINREIEYIFSALSFHSKKTTRIRNKATLQEGKKVL